MYIGISIYPYTDIVEHEIKLSNRIFVGKLDSQSDSDHLPKQETIGTVFKDEISLKWSLKVLIDNEVQIKNDFLVLNISIPETFCWIKPGRLVKLFN